MSDFYIRLIATEPHWQPTPAAAEATAGYVAGLFSGPGDDVEEVRPRFYDRVTLIDSGENTTSAACPRCAADLDFDWVFRHIDDKGALDDLNVMAPCCEAVVGLNTLHYDWAMGFARFEVSAMNATRARYELDDDELAEAGALLGHPVTQILAHY